MFRRSFVAFSMTAPFGVALVQASEKPTAENQVKASQLSLYNAPEPTKYEYIEEEITDFRKIVSKVRQAVWNYMDSMKDTTEVAKEKFEIGKAHSSNLLYRIQEDSGLMGRSAIIVVAGLGGTVLGYRSGYGRRLFYATSGMVSATALCYPNEAVAISRSAWSKASDAWNQAAKGAGGSKTETKDSEVKTAKEEKNSTESS